MAHEFNLNLRSAREDFRRARWQAIRREVVSRLSGKPIELLSYGDVRQQLGGVEGSRRILEEIPIVAIIGSVGRSGEFTRDFLPRKSVREDRWAGVKMAMTGLNGVPPIEVYQIGDAYFVQDGHHRVSVARQMGLSRIEAYVTRVWTEMPFCPKGQANALSVRSDYSPQTAWVGCPG